MPEMPEMPEKARNAAFFEVFHEISGEFEITLNPHIFSDINNVYTHFSKTNCFFATLGI